MRAKVEILAGLTMVLLFSQSAAGTELQSPMKQGSARGSQSVSEMYVELGKFYAGHSLYSKALGFFQKAKPRDTGNESLYFSLGWTQAMLGNYENAIESFKNALSADPKYRDAQYYLGRTYVLAGLLNEAVACFKEAAHLDDGSGRDDEPGATRADVYLNLSNVYARLGRKTDAEKARGIADRTTSRYPDAIRAGWIKYSKLGEHTDSEDDLTKRVQADSHNFDAYVALAEFYCKSGRYAKGVEAYEQAMNVDSGIDPDPDVMVGLALLYSELGQRNKGIGLLKKACITSPEYAVPHFALGLLHIYAGQKEKAIKEQRWLSEHYEADIGKILLRFTQGDLILDNDLQHRK